MNCGTIKDCQGTAIVATYARKSTSRPFHVMREKPYAAKLEVITVKNVITTVKVAVFLKKVANGIISQIFT